MGGYSRPICGDDHQKYRNLRTVKPTNSPGCWVMNTTTSWVNTSFSCSSVASVNRSCNSGEAAANTSWPVGKWLDPEAVGLLPFHTSSKLELMNTGRPSTDQPRTTQG